eukprot:gene4601-5845_t
MRSRSVHHRRGEELDDDETSVKAKKRPVTVGDNNNPNNSNYPESAGNDGNNRNRLSTEARRSNQKGNQNHPQNNNGGHIRANVNPRQARINASNKAPLPPTTARDRNSYEGGGGGGSSVSKQAQSNHRGSTQQVENSLSVLVNDVLSVECAKGVGNKESLLNGRGGGGEDNDRLVGRNGRASKLPVSVSKASPKVGRDSRLGTIEEETNGGQQRVARYRSSSGQDGESGSPFRGQASPGLPSPVQTRTRSSSQGPQSPKVVGAAVAHQSGGTSLSRAVQFASNASLSVITSHAPTPTSHSPYEGHNRAGETPSKIQGGSQLTRTSALASAQLQTQELQSESEYLYMAHDQLDIISGDQLDRLLMQSTRANSASIATGSRM